MEEDGEEDLYGDLYENVDGAQKPVLKASLIEMQERLKILEKAQADLKGSKKALEQQVAELESQRSVLVTNISCLFKTAQMEITRKDTLIKELRAENMRLISGQSSAEAASAEPRRDSSARPSAEAVSHDWKPHAFQDSVPASTGRASAPKQEDGNPGEPLGSRARGDGRELKEAGSARVGDRGESLAGGKESLDRRREDLERRRNENTFFKDINRAENRQRGTRGREEREERDEYRRGDRLREPEYGSSSSGRRASRGEDGRIAARGWSESRSRHERDSAERRKAQQ